MAIITESANAGIGAVGSACILLAYVLITFSVILSNWSGGRITTTGRSLHYQLLNLVGGGLAAASAYLTENKGALPLAVLETIWAIIALCGLFDIFCSRKQGPASTEDGVSEGQGRIDTK